MFKKMAMFAAIAGMVFTLGAVAQAELYVYEPFDYPVGATADGQTGVMGLLPWTNGGNIIRAPGMTYIDDNREILPVSGNYMEYSGGPRMNIDTSLWPASYVTNDGLGNPDSVRLGAPGATIWMSYLRKGFDFGNYYEDIAIGPKLLIGKYYWDKTLSVIWNQPPSDPTTASVIDEHFILIRHQTNLAGDTVVDMWVDPPLADEAGLPALNDSPAGDFQSTSAVIAGGHTFNSWQFRNGGGGGRFYAYDEIRMGTTYDDVTSAIHPQPPLFWQGGNGQWSNPNWTTTPGGVAENLPPTAGTEMTIDEAGSVVTVAADFKNGVKGPAFSVAVGENNPAELGINSGITLDVVSAVAVGIGGTLNVNGTLNAQGLDSSGDVDFTATSGGIIVTADVSAGTADFVTGSTVNVTTLHTAGTTTLGGGSFGTVNVTGGTATFDSGSTASIDTLTSAGETTFKSGSTASIGTLTPTDGTTTFESGSKGSIDTLTSTGGTTTFESGSTPSVDTINVSGGTVTLNGASNSLDTVSVSGGSLTFGGGTNTAGTLKLGGGTVDAGAGVEVTSTIEHGDTTFAVSGGSSMHVTGSDLLTAANVRLPSGKIDITRLEPGIAPNAIAETIWDAALNNNDVRGNIENIRTAAAGPLGPSDAQGLLKAHLHYQNDAAVSARAAALGAVGFDNGNFTMLWTTELTPNENGDWGFRNNRVDDRFSFWIDLSQDGTFQSDERFFVRGGCCVGSGDRFISQAGSAIDSLNLGQTYKLGLVMNDTGGGGYFRDMEFKAPSGAWTNLDPSDPAQAGLWAAEGLVPAVSISRPGVNIAVEADAELASESSLVTLGNLTVPDSATVTLTGAAFSFNNVSTGVDAALTGSAAVRGTLDVGGAPDVVAALAANDLELAAGSTFRVEVAGAFGDNDFVDVAGLLTLPKVDPFTIDVQDAGAEAAGGLVNEDVLLMTYNTFSWDTTFTGDVNGDNTVNDEDLNLLLSAIGSPAFDVDGDGGDVDVDDVTALLAQFGNVSGAGTIDNATVVLPPGWTAGDVTFDSDLGELTLTGVNAPAALSSVPEPGTLVLLMLGALGLAPLARRLRK